MSSSGGGDPPAPPPPPPAAFRLLWSCPAGLPRSRVRVDFNPSYARVPHPDASLEQSVAETWHRRLAQQPHLFNGTKFRYAGCCYSGTQQEEEVRLRLGLTDYRHFVGTNLHPAWSRFLSPPPPSSDSSSAPDDDDARRCRHLACPLGNAAVVETADGRVLTLRRSSDVGECPGGLVFPGGHPEPAEAGISDHDDARCPSPSSEQEEVNRRVEAEMFDGMVREVVEETGVPAAALGDPLFIGLSQRAENVRPTAFFYLRCSLTAAEVHALYARAAHAFESTELCALSPEELRERAAQMPGCHQGGAALFALRRLSEQQCAEVG